MQKVIFKISGMHCTSCAMNIDGELEDSEKIISVSTSYPKQQAIVEYDPEIVSEDEIQRIIEKTGYKAEKM